MPTTTIPHELTIEEMKSKIAEAEKANIEACQTKINIALKEHNLSLMTLMNYNNIAQSVVKIINEAQKEIVLQPNK